MKFPDLQTANTSQSLRKINKLQVSTMEAAHRMLTHLLFTNTCCHPLIRVLKCSYLTKKRQEGFNKLIINKYVFLSRTGK